MSRPPKEIPLELINEFTLNKKIPVTFRYYDDSCDLYYDSAQVNSLLQKAESKSWNYYGAQDGFLYNAFEKYLKDKQNILVFGTTKPWYEAICHSYGLRDITICKRCRVTCETNLYKYLQPEDLQNEARRFSNILSISAFEHEGLGRYGDSINPNGDLQIMQTIREYIEDGILFLSIPVGADNLIWNAKRIYGRIRLPMILSGWKLIESFGFDESMYSLRPDDCHYPIFVLKK